MSTWIIQRKIFKGDWETIAAFNARNKQNALDRYAHMNGKLRAVSEVQAERDYQAGRADNWKKKVGTAMDRLVRAHTPLTAKQLEEMDAAAAEETDDTCPKCGSSNCSHSWELSQPIYPQDFKRVFPVESDRHLVTEMQALAIKADAIVNTTPTTGIQAMQRLNQMADDYESEAMSELTLPQLWERLERLEAGVARAKELRKGWADEIRYRVKNNDPAIDTMTEVRAAFAVADEILKGFEPTSADIF